MPRIRTIQPTEARLWLEVLLAYSISSLHAQRTAQHDLLDIARDATAYPDNISEERLAELLLGWADKHVSGVVWQRLQARIRKRRYTLKELLDQCDASAPIMPDDQEGP